MKKEAKLKEDDALNPLVPGHRLFLGVDMPPGEEDSSAPRRMQRCNCRLSVAPAVTLGRVWDPERKNLERIRLSPTLNKPCYLNSTVSQTFPFSNPLFVFLSSFFSLFATGGYSSFFS